MLCLHSIGMDIHHHGDFCIRRPHGSGDWLLVIFKTEATVMLDSAELTVSPGNAVLFAPGEPQFYGSISGAYINHFVHFAGQEIDDFSAFPYNKLLTIGNLREVEELMQMLCREQLSLSVKKDAYVDLLLRLLMLKLTDGCSIGRQAASGVYSAKLNMLRADLYANPGRYESVEEMSASLGLSLSYIHQLYREQFGVSCYEDILEARMNAARYYLQNTTITVREISALCGYENDVVFMRLFKSRTGMTPTTYRNQFVKE